jgi:uncharacterized protein YjiS (DUF1127 family)
MLTHSPASGRVRPRHPLPLLPLFAGSVGCALSVVRDWIERGRERRQLGTFDDHLLKDIGVTRRQVERELAKPFWRP